MGILCGSSALSSRICASHSELRWSSCTGATPLLTPQAGSCLHFPAACPVVLICLVAWPCCLTGLVNDAAKIVSPPLFFFNDMISLLSVTVGKMKTREGQSLSSQPWHHRVQNAAPCSEQLLCSGKSLKRHLRYWFASVCWILFQIWLF